MPDLPTDLLAAGDVAQELTHNEVNGATGGIWRVRGTSGSRVLKISHFTDTAGPRPEWHTSNEPAHWNYWKRESLAYRSGLVATAYADAGIVGPRLLDAQDRPDGSVALWLEDIAGEPAAGWTTAQYADFTTRLGAAQAGWVGRPLPYPWLSRNWLRQYAALRTLPRAVDWSTAAVVEAWPADLRDGLAWLQTAREALLDAADRGPRTLAHLDVWPANMVWPASTAGALANTAGALANTVAAPAGPAGAPAGPVLLDWAFAGDGAVGEDIGNLLFDTFADGMVDIDRLADIEEALVDGYLTGLGSSVGAVDARRGMYATAAAKYAAFAPSIVRRVAAGESVGSQFYDAGRSVAQRLERWRPLLVRLVEWARAALGVR